VAQLRPEAGRAGERDPAPGDGLLRSGLPPKEIYPLVVDLVVAGIPVAVTCWVLGFSKQAYDEWRAAPVTDQDWDDAHLINAALPSTTTTRSSATASSPTSWPTKASA